MRQICERKPYYKFHSPAAFLSRRDAVGGGACPLCNPLSPMIGDTVCVGSRNLTPTRVAGHHLPTAKVTATFTLGNGVHSQSLATDGKGLL